MIYYIRRVLNKGALCGQERVSMRVPSVMRGIKEASWYITIQQWRFLDVFHDVA